MSPQSSESPELLSLAADQNRQGVLVKTSLHFHSVEEEEEV